LILLDYVGCYLGFLWVIVALKKSSGRYIDSLGRMDDSLLKVISSSQNKLG
jgi:hypothetical protein